MKKLLILMSLFTLAGCASKESGAISSSSESSGELSLAEQKNEIEELRKNIPEDKRRENDKLKDILTLMHNPQLSPEVMRERFNRVTQRLREGHRRDTQRARDEFNKTQKNERNEFQKKAKEKRDEFTKRKRSSEERKEFFAEQDQERRKFNADQNDKRDLFYSDAKIKNDDFMQGLKDQTSEFNAQLKAYSVKYREKQEAARKAKTSDSNSSTLESVIKGDSAGDGQ